MLSKHLVTRTRVVMFVVNLRTLLSAAALKEDCSRANDDRRHIHIQRKTGTHIHTEDDDERGLFLW